MFGPQRFVPMSWMCRKQTEVSHSSAETETISLDAGLRVERTPALLVWDWVMETCSHYSAGRNLKRPNHERHLQFHSDNHMSFDMVDHAPYTIPGHFLFEDSEAVIRMITKGRSRVLWHVSRAHRVQSRWISKFQ